MVFNIRAYRELVRTLRLGTAKAAEIFGTQHKNNNNPQCGLSETAFNNAIDRLSDNNARCYFRWWFVRSEELIREGLTTKIDCTPQLQYAYRYILNKPVKVFDKIDVLRELATKALSDRSSSYQLAPIEELIRGATAYSEDKYMSDTQFELVQVTDSTSINQNNEISTNTLDSILRTNQQILETMQQLIPAEEMPPDGRELAHELFNKIQNRGRFLSYKKHMTAII